MNSRRPFSRWALAFASACALASSTSAQTTITKTSGFGGAGSITTAGSPGSQMITIPANAGVQNGANLFHSFSQFDVGAGDTAKFTATGSTAPVSNIIARIFSASPSSINGNLLVDPSGNFASANLFLINPKGVMFGPNSSVNVPGDFVTSTSDYITLSDGVSTGFFYADPTASANTTLSNSIMAAPVSAFGFLKAQDLSTAAGITVNGGATLTAGGSLQFVTSKFAATSGTTLAVSNAGSPLGIFAGSQTDPNHDGTVPYLTGTVTSYSGATGEAHFTQHGAINLGDSGGGASVTSTGIGGSVVIRGGQLMQLGGATSITKAASKVSIKADSFTLAGKVQTTAATGTIGVDTTGTVTLNGGTITSAGGSISMGAGALGGLSLDSASTITETAGSGGTLSLTSTGTITNAGTISTVGSTNALSISTLNLALNGGTISSGTGAIGIDAIGTTSLTTVGTTGSTITSAGGSITMGGMSLVDLTLDAMSSITETAGNGKTLRIASTGTITSAGTISTVGGTNPLAISAQTFALNSTGTISTVTSALNIDTTGDTTLTNGFITSAGGAITLGQTSLRNLTLDSISGIEQSGSMTAPITIKATGTITNGGQISAVGDGALTVNAQSMLMTGTLMTFMGPLTVNTTGATTLNGGDILSSGAITLGNTSLGSLTMGPGSHLAVIWSEGGTVSVTTTGDLTMTSGMIETTNNTATRSGNLSVEVPNGNITLSGGAEIASFSGGSGGSGDVSVNSGVSAQNNTKTLSITGTGVNAFSSGVLNGQSAFDSGSGIEAPNTGIFSIATGTGSAGNVNVIAIGNVALSAGGQIAAIQANAAGGNTGSVNLTLNPDSFFAVGVNSLTIGGVTAAVGTNPVTVPIIFTSTVNPASSAGAVTINALSTTITLQPGAAIQTSTQDGQAGNVSVFGGSVTLDPYSDIQSLMSQTSSMDTATSGRTGSVLVEVFNLNLNNFSFVGPLSIADNAFIQTVANPKAKGFDPVGGVQVYSGSLSEGGMNVPAQMDGYDYAYKIKGHTQILAVNNATLNGANGSDISSTNKVRVEDLIGFPSSTSTPTPLPAAGNGIVLDGTLNGSRTGVLDPIAAVPDSSGVSYTYTIDPTDGTSVGANLFLSFAQFDLGFNATGPVNETAVFNAPGVTNIIARVTDGIASKIDGAIAEASGTTANLFLLNPAGMIFTANSNLNLNGALTLSTADSIGLQKGGVFFAAPNTLTDNSIVPTATAFYNGTVQAFDFTATAPKGITLDAASLSNAASGQIQIIAGDITLKDDALLNSSQTLLFSTGSAGLLEFNSGDSLTAAAPTPLLAASGIVTENGFGALGTVSLTGGSVLTVPTPNIASTIVIRAKTFSLTDSLIVDQTTAEDGSVAGEVLIDVTGAATIATSASANGASFISTSALGDEQGGAVYINAASLTITGSVSDSATTGILSTAQPSSYYTSDQGYVPFSYPGPDLVSGSAGSVTLNIGGAITLSNFGQVSTNTTGRGNAGTITVRGLNGVLPQISVSGGASISSSTNIDPANNGAFTRTGNAGTVTLNASALTVTGAGSQIVSSAGTSLETGPTGRGGNINITVDGSMGTGIGSTGDITVSNSGQISASSFNTSLAGLISIFQSNSTDLAAPATNPTIIGGLSVASGASITTADNGPGTTAQNSSAGELRLDVQAVTVNGGSITSSTLGASNAGAVEINGFNGAFTDFVLVENGGVISSNTGGAGGSGLGGTITINTGALTVTGTNSAISTSSTNGTGSGGSISLQVRGNASVLGSTGDLVVAASGEVSASSDTVGQAGGVTIMQSNSIDLADPATNPATIGGVDVNGGSISTAADGTGTTSLHPNVNPGTITITTQALTVNGANGAITSSTFGLSKAGSISVAGAGTPNAQFVRVTNGGSISSNTGGAGFGGTISIQTGALTVTGPNSEISTNAIFGSGSGGSITLTVQGNAARAGSTGDVMLTNGGAVSALSLTTGEAGTVTITQKGSTDLTDPATNPVNMGGIDIDNGSITTLAFGPGVISASGSTAGDITLNTQALTMNAGAQIVSSTFGLSKAGTITVNGALNGTLTQWIMVKGGAQIASNTSGLGAGGAITINAGALTLDGTPALPATTASAITTSATANIPTTNTGSGGSITLNVTGNAAIVGATGDVAILNGGTISASSNTTGDAGTVTITQVGSRDIIYPTLTTTTNGGLLLNDGIITTAADGAGVANSLDTLAGDITLRTEALTMTHGSLVLSSTAGASKAGDVTVSGPTVDSNTQFVVMQNGASMASETSGAGNGGKITMGTGSLLVDDSALSTSATGGTGNGGDIAITAVAAMAGVDSFVNLQHGGTIASSSVSSGAAGKITISADRITVTGAGAAISTNAGAVGNASNTQGEIVLVGQDLFIDKSGLISATTGGFSPGGTITVKAANEVDLETNARLDASSTAGTGGGNGGSILIGSNPDGPLNDIGLGSPFTVSLTDNSVIRCDSSNTNGGNIGIQTGALFMDHSLISTSEPNGPTNTIGGNITVRAAYTFYLNNFSFINSNAGQGTGGNITIDPQFTILNHSGINAIGGSANGNVFILSDFVLSGTSSILATGVVDINSLPLDLTGSLLPLPANLTDEQKRLREKCARAVNHEFSSFIVVGRGGTESAPEEFQPDFGLDLLPANPSLNATR